MPVSQRHSEKIARERKCKNVTPSVRQQFVKTHNTLREAERAFRQLAFRKYRLSRPKMDRVGETLKFADLGRVGGGSAKQDWEDGTGHFATPNIHFLNST